MPLDRLPNLIPERLRRPAVLAAWVVAWAACILGAAGRIEHARVEFLTRDTTPEREVRADGNNGHALIDFGGQFIMGRMGATGHGRELYHRQAQWPVVWESFPKDGEAPLTRDLAFPKHRRAPADRAKNLAHDAENLMEWVTGTDAPQWTPAAAAATLPLASTHPLAAAALTVTAAERVTPELVEAVNRPAIGGPLYPPVHALAYAPLAMTNNPRAAYHFFQWLSLALTFTAGMAITEITGGRVWWPLATLAVIAFPGHRCGLDLGQNMVITLNILLWGWVFLLRGRDGWAGFAWGLLAFKPIWAVAFLVVPLVMGRWRMLAAMVATGAAAILVTLPFVGVQSWLDWLEVGRMATETYSHNENWIRLSRDLGGVVRRVAIDFSLPEGERDSPAIRRACTALLVVVLTATVVVYRLRHRPGGVTGASAGFLVLGAYLCCYRFMYYDALLALLPLAVLAGDPRRLAGGVYQVRPAAGGSGGLTCSINSIVPTALALLVVADNVLLPLGLEVSLSFGFLGGAPTSIGGLPAAAPKIAADTTVYTPVDTVVLLAVWACLAVKLVVWGDDPPSPAEERG